MHRAVTAHIPAVDIGIETRIDHRMVKSRIEYGLILVAATLDTCPAQSIVPRTVCLTCHAVEILVGDLGLEVAARTIHIDKRYADLERHLLVSLGIELGIESQMPALHAAAPLDNGSRGNTLQIALAHNLVALAHPIVRNVGTPDTETIHRTAQLSMEIYRIVDLAVAVAPTARLRRAVHPTLDRTVVHDLHILTFGRTANAPRKIDLYARRVALWKCETQDAATGRCRTLGLDVVVRQMHAVISRTRTLRRLVIM